jgi:hypothetical protein
VETTGGGIEARRGAALDAAADLHLAGTASTKATGSKPEPTSFRLTRERGPGFESREIKALSGCSKFRVLSRDFAVQPGKEIGNNETGETPRKSRHGASGSGHPQDELDLLHNSLKFRLFRPFRCSHLGF